MSEFTREHEGENFHVAMAVGAEALAGRDDIVVQDAQRAERVVLGVNVLAEGKGVAAVEPVDLGEATLVGRTEGAHERWLARTLSS